MTTQDAMYYFLFFFVALPFAAVIAGAILAFTADRFDAIATWLNRRQFARRHPTRAQRRANRR